MKTGNVRTALAAALIIGATGFTENHRTPVTFGRQVIMGSYYKHRLMAMHTHSFKGDISDDGRHQKDAKYNKKDLFPRFQGLFQYHDIVRLVVSVTQWKWRMLKGNNWPCRTRQLSR